MSKLSDCVTTLQVQESADEGQKGDLGGGGDERAHYSAASIRVQQAQVRPDQVADQKADLQEGLGLHDQIQHQEEEFEVWLILLINENYFHFVHNLITPPQRFDFEIT